MDGKGLLISLIQESIEEVMHVLTFAVLGATPKSMLFQGVVPRQCPTQIVISPSLHL